jgi:superfamily II DNA helicase RecQ
VLNYVNDKIAELTDDQRGIIFCITKAEAERMAEVLNCDFYHAAATKLDDRMKRWRDGRKPIIVGTSALGCGIDHSLSSLSSILASHQQW